MRLAVLSFLTPQLRMRLTVSALNAVFESAIVNAVCSFTICGHFAVAAFLTCEDGVKIFAAVLRLR